MGSNRSATTPKSEDSAARSARALALATAIFGGMVLVIRPLAGQAVHYRPDVAFAGLLTILLVCAAALRAAVSTEKCGAPDSLMAAVILWSGIFIWGAIRSPNPGASVPLAADAILYALVLFAGYFLGRLEPAFRGIFVRVIIAIVVVEAFAAIWQIYVDLPRLRQQIASGEVIAPDALNSKIGLDRLNGDDAYVTFENPNSLAGFLLVGFFLLLGHAFDPVRARFAELFAAKRDQKNAHPKSTAVQVLLLSASVVSGALMLVALYWTGSKGGGVALLLGLWFFALQRWNKRLPILNTLTIAGVAVLIVLLALGLTDAIPSRYFGLSMQVRFEYWKAALAMFARHPLDGVGLGGYAEWASFFKTPMGWETKDPHNEFMSLLAELGVLGPLVYALIWFLILKHCREPRAAENRETAIAPRRNFEMLTVIAGAFGMLFAICVFGVFNSSDVFAVLQGRADAIACACAAQTLFLPFLFALVVAALHADAGFLSKRSESFESKSPAMVQGFRAAAGAALMHQLVDFDFKAQAVMAALMLCGGLFWGETDGSERAPGRATFLSKYSGWLTLAFALALLPAAFWIPLQSGTARAEADELRAYLDLIAAQPERTQPGLSTEEARTELLAQRKLASEDAPFDSEARVEWALACASLRPNAAFSANEREVLSLLDEALALRPCSAQIRVYIGCLYFRRGLNSSVAEARQNFEKARAAFAAASALYPLHPGLKFMEGDALLLMGEGERASEKYWDAFETDMRINDPNVYISSIFTDPRPGVVSRHNSDEAVRAAITALFASNAPFTKTPHAAAGLFTRDACALVNLLIERRRNEAAQILAPVRKRDLLRAVEKLSQLPLDLPERAHASLLFALGLNYLKAETFISESQIKAAFEKARELQSESIRQGHPGTVPSIFNDAIARK